MGIAELIIAMAEDRGAKKVEAKAKRRIKTPARAMKKDNLSVKQIVKYTKLSPEQIEAL